MKDVIAMLKDRARHCRERATAYDREVEDYNQRSAYSRREADALTKRAAEIDAAIAKLEK